MGSKRHLHHLLVTIRRIKAWQLVLLIIVFTGLSAFLLRQNNLDMVELRNAVKQADEQGGDTKQALINLQRYVSAHMNTNLGDGVALQNAYKSAYDAAVQAAVNVSNPTSKVYEQVEAQCRPVFKRTGSFPAYTQCAHDKLSQLAPGQDPLANLKTPSPDLFRYNFSSPLWSPDFAGFAVLLTVVFVLMLLTRLISYLILRAILRTHA